MPIPYLAIAEMIPGLRGSMFLNNIVISRLVNRCRTHRPRPWSRAARYTTWGGLTDKSWMGLHLGPVETAAGLPPVDEVAKLFKRRRNPTGEPLMLKCEHGTTLLFAFVAQWFTDSFLRTDSARGPGRTDSNHEVDLCQIYGLTEGATRLLRQPDGQGGRTRHLAHRVVDGEVWPERMFHRDASGEIVPKPQFVDAAGTPLHSVADQRARIVNEKALPRLKTPQVDDRLLALHAVGLNNGNNNVGYTVVNTLFLRAHNAIADELHGLYGPGTGHGWDEDRIFETTRCILTVLLIKVVIREYIGQIADHDFRTPVGFADDKRWGKPNKIALEFNLLYRWHSMLPDEMPGPQGALAQEEFRYNPALVEKFPLGAWLDVFSKQKAGRISLFNVPDFLSRGVNELIQAGRDAGLPGYNAYRRQFSLDPVPSFRALVGRQPDAPRIVERLEALYPGGPGDLDLVVGLFAEGHYGSTIMGELMVRMVGYDAFTQLLNNPLLSGNVHNAGTFSRHGMALIGSVETLAAVAAKAGIDPRNHACSLGRRNGGRSRLAL